MGKSVSKDLLIEVAAASKKFSKDLKSTMIYGMLDVLRIVFGFSIHNTGLRKNEFWALSDFSLQLHRGEIIGIMGVNGAGKTTLIRLITGTYPVDQGSIRIYGRISSLFAVTLGMNPLCSGRENVYLRMAMYGILHEQVDKMMDELIAFAELEQFIDSPLGTYSSGMRARLGFAIALFSKPDIIIIDEGLAVGDIAFRAKCFKALRDIRDETATIIVSHSINQITNMANRIIVMDKGSKLYESNDVADGIDYYIRNCVSKAEEGSSDYGLVRLDGIRLFANDRVETDGDMFSIDYLGELGMELDLHTTGQTNDEGVVMVDISDSSKTIVAGTRSDQFGYTVKLNQEKQSVKMLFPSLQLKPDIYHISISVRDIHTGYPMAMGSFVKKFQVKGFIDSETAVHLQSEWTSTSGQNQKLFSSD